jgi:protein-S-isoprenylcysteine O-methyltransferase Ste14
LAQSGFWWILLIGAAYGVLHSTLASNRVKNLAARRFGRVFPRHYRLFFTLVASISTLAYFGAILLFPDHPLYLIRPPWLYLTLITQLIAGVCFITALFQNSLLGFSGLASLFSNKSSRAERLTTGGFYRFTRHPLYLFALITLWLLPIMTWNVLALAIGVTVYTLIGSLLEERRLAQQFGQEYTAYKERTPWLLPIHFK